jgi:hypothetical protein
MNERIKELMEQSGAYDYYEVNEGVDGDEQPMIKFAELIVRECLSLGDVLSEHYINTHPEQKQAWLLASIADYKNEIKKYFGVEK